MRSLALALTLALTIFGLLSSAPAATPGVVSITPDYDPVTYMYSSQISTFFKSKGCTSKAPCGNERWVLEFTSQQLKWLRYFRIEHTAEKFLANTVAESWYRPNAISSAGAYGATQVYSEAEARKELRRRGIEVGPLTDYRAQAALGVTVFWMKLQRADGEPWKAVELYNGGGKAALAHRNKVWRIHRKIFG